MTNLEQRPDASDPVGPDARRVAAGSHAASAAAQEEYRTIVADPPWAYDDGFPDGSTSPNSKEPSWKPMEQRKARRSLPYDSMSVDAICGLDVPSADDAHLLLWTTNRYVLDAYKVAQAWGFKHSQLLTWCKLPMGLGIGGVFTSTTEFVLYARKGKPKHEQRVDSTWWQWSRSAHSVKPDAFLDLVEQTFPGPYLEMFARRARFGWDYWGNESLSTAEVAA